MSIEKLKSELVEAGLPASEGPHLSVEDHRLLKDLLYFQGRNLMQELQEIGFRALNKIEGWPGIEQQNPDTTPPLVPEAPETPEQPLIAPTGSDAAKTEEAPTEEEPKSEPAPEAEVQSGEVETGAPEVEAPAAE